MKFSKAFPLKSGGARSFRAEMYNIFNHTQFTGANISPQYNWPLWQTAFCSRQRQPRPVHVGCEPAADVAVVAFAVLTAR